MKQGIYKPFSWMTLLKKTALKSVLQFKRSKHIKGQTTGSSIVLYYVEKVQQYIQLKYWMTTGLLFISKYRAVWLCMYLQHYVYDTYLRISLASKDWIMSIFL